MLQINLLPVREARREEDLRQFRNQGLLVLLLVCAAIGFAWSHINEEIANSNTRIAQMQRDIDQYNPQLEQVAAFRKKKKELETKIGVIDELDRARSGPVRVLSELAARTPDRLWLTSLSTEGATILMAGESLDNDLVALFLRSLGESRYFAEVDLDRTEMKGNKDGLQLVSFRIRALLVNPDPNPPADAA
ncbi:MAG TPA: PilN domain-containing protein [Myxococcota bacterium]